MNNIVDFMQFKDQKQRLENLSKMPDLSKLGAAELGSLVQTLTKVTLQQSDMIASLMQENASIFSQFVELQDQCGLISMQAYIALQLLKEKDICTAEEVNNKWQQMLNEKVLKNQGLPEEVTDTVPVTE